MYYDILSKIKNAQRARKETLQVPFSNFDFAVAKILAQGRYIALAEKKTVNKKNFIEMTLAYREGEPGLSDFKIISRPGRHVYMGYKQLRPVRQNYGTAILSTPAGILTNKEARRQKVGGEYLCQVW